MPLTHQFDPGAATEGRPYRPKTEFLERMLATDFSLCARKQVSIYSRGREFTVEVGKRDLSPLGSARLATHNRSGDKSLFPTANVIQACSGLRHILVNAYQAANRVFGPHTNAATRVCGRKFFSAY